MHDSATALDAFFTQYFARHPVTATFTGVHDHDGLLPDWSDTGRRADAEERRVLVELLRETYPVEPAEPAVWRSDAVALDAELARANLKVRQAEADSGHFVDRNPTLWTGEAIFGCVSLMLRAFAPAADRAQSLRARLSAIPAFLTEMPRAITLPVPSLWRERAISECVVAQQLFGDALAQWCAANGLATDDAPLTTAATGARLAFEDARRWLERLPAGDMHDVGCGEALMTVLLRRGHFCDETPRELLARAEHAMEEESDSLAGVLAALFDGRWSNAQVAMADDRPTVENYWSTFERRWQDVYQAALAQQVVSWTTSPIRYVPIPEWARVAQPQLYWLYYRSPAPFDRVDTYEYFVPPVDASLSEQTQQLRLAAWNHSVITLNHVVHHGGLGHHVQNGHATMRSSSRIGTIAAVDGANRIGMFLGGTMAEGWACYATQLAEEMGVLTPLERVSEQHTRVRLLARAIVDLRLHLREWTFDECVAYYQSQVGMSLAVATAETTKNSMFPATALMYWLGTDAIVTLRERKRQELGAAFNAQHFHDDLLSRGAIPVPLIAKLMTGRS